MAATFQLLDLLDTYESYADAYGDSDSASVQENIADKAKGVVAELQALRPILESQEFVNLLEFYEDKL